MVVDSSALIAIITGEPESRAFIDAISSATICLAPAPTMMETSMVVLGRHGEAKLQDLRDFCTRSAIEIAAFGPEHVDLAIDAFRRYGKGRHPAGLNFGDCFSYALAKATGQPLLFKGDDFSKTDIKRAA